MNNTPASDLPDPAQALQHALRERDEALSTVAVMAARIESLERMTEWFKRQLFGPKSERRLVDVNAHQMHFGEDILGDAPEKPSEKRRTVSSHTRTQRGTDVTADQGADTSFFDEAKVPVETIEVDAPEARDLPPEAYEVIDHKATHRLAQRPGSYVVIRYVRPVIKIKAEERVICPPAPAGVLENSRADVSLLAGIVIDKLSWHLPLYRQHQRMQQAGVKVSRTWLTQLVKLACALLDPIVNAQFESVIASRVLAMDETPIRAGKGKHPGKMNIGQIWPLFGDKDEVHFHYSPSRGAKVVFELLHGRRPEDAVLLSDGYSAYVSYIGRVGGTHALCWSHTRRKFLEAETTEPDLVNEALDRIRQIYDVENAIRTAKLTGEKKRLHRVTHSKPVVDAFFAWLLECQATHGLLPSNRFMTAINYALERRRGLQVFLHDPEVPIDTNHVERAIRPTALGRKNWLFCWTELGAERLASLQSLIYTCMLHDIDPYTYLVDVLQRVGQHPASRVHELTPRLWKQHFAANPLRAPLDRITP